MDVPLITTKCLLSLLLLLQTFNPCYGLVRQDVNADENNDASINNEPRSTSDDSHHSNYTSCHGLAVTTVISKTVNQDVPNELSSFSFFDRSCYCEPNRPYIYNVETKACPVVCTTCDVEFPRCLIHNICCPNGNNFIDSNGKPGGDSTQVNPYNTKTLCVEFELGVHYLVVRSCPINYDDGVTRTLCEDELPVHNVSVATVIVVSDENTNVTYYNKYCAQCNNATRVKAWRPVIHCESNVHMVSALTKEDYVRLSMRNSATCVIRQHPEDVHAVLCEPSLYSQDEDQIISSCNVTGLETQVTQLEDKCDNAPGHISTRVRHGRVSYKNIYCLMCNSQVAKKQRRSSCFTLVGFDRAPFKFFFGLDDGGFDQQPDMILTSDRDTATCQTNEWMDPTGTCRKLLCPEGKALRGDRCETVLAEEIVGLPYRAGLLLVPRAYNFYNTSDTMTEPTMDEMMAAIQEKVKSILAPYVMEVTIKMNVLFDQEIVNPRYEVNTRNNTTTEANQRAFVMPQYVWMKLYFICPSDNTRDFYERGILNSLNSSVEVLSGGSFPVQYDLHLVDELSFDIDSSCNGFPNATFCQISTNSYFKRNFESNAELVPTFFEISVVNTPRWEYVEIRECLLCPFVELSHEEVLETTNTLPVPHVTNIVLQFQNSRFEFDDPAAIRQIHLRKNGRVSACLELLSSVVYRGTSEQNGLLNMIQYVLTIVCVAASLICLFATVVTYCLFWSLRNVAGSNTLGLSLSLMVAQILLFVANEIDGPSTVCTAVGVITHYAWLVMFTWTFLCCLNILKVFARLRATNRSNPSQERKAIASNVITSFLAPALIVGVIMGTYLVSSQGQRLGYGYSSCAMDSPFAIHGPLIFVITCNTIFFTVAVCKIWGVRRLRDSMDIGKEDRKDFVIYIKLSTLTGMFWLLVILGEVFYNDVIRCLAIILNGSQGVFIFFSFIANKRVLKFYLEKFKRV